MELSFDYVQSPFGKAIILVVVAFLIWCLWPRGTKQVNKPVVSGVAFPGSYVAPDQRSTQVQVTEKPWEVGFGGVGGQVNDKPAYGVILFCRYKF